MQRHLKLSFMMESAGWVEQASIWFFTAERLEIGRCPVHKRMR